MDSSQKPESSDDDTQFKVTTFQRMGAACVGGFLSSFLITPLDVLKVRLQAQQRNPSSLYKYSGTLDAAWKMTRFEGVTSLWSGLLPTTILTVPAMVIYFVSYDQLKNRLEILSGSNLIHQAHPPPPWISILAGGTARMLSLTAVSPLELVRTKMQSERMSYFQMNEAVQSLIRSHGIIGLWKGIAPTLMRSVPYAGIYWVIYEKLKSFSKDGNLSFTYSFVAGCISGTAAVFMTNPFDVVKTLYQTDFVNKQALSGNQRETCLTVIRHLIDCNMKSYERYLASGYCFIRRNKSVLRTLKSIYASKGIIGLYSGLTPRLIKVIPQGAITVSTFEAGKKYFQKQNLNRHVQSNNKGGKSGIIKQS